MSLFSERYGYTKPSDVLIRESMPIPVCNSICTVFDNLRLELYGSYYNQESYEALELYLWCNYFHKRRNDFFLPYERTKSVIVPFFQDSDVLWYEKLNLLEVCTKWLYENVRRQSVVKNFVLEINKYFGQLSYSYRIVNYEVIEITGKEEIKAIEDALSCSKENVRCHLDHALALLAKKPEGDYRNSIKESITAVEAICREFTGEKELGGALNHLNSKGVKVPVVLKDAFVKLYAYTNQPSTGIRHALMDDSEGYVPGREEATFMLVSCSAFINYLRTKIK